MRRGVALGAQKIEDPCGRSDANDDALQLKARSVKARGAQVSLTWR